MADREPLRVYTDGACSGNPGPGGWAWASGPDHHDSGGEAATTNNRMELTAVMRAIESNPGPLVVVMDSTYVKDGLESWSRNWVRNGWKTKAGQPVKNDDLWRRLIDLRDARPRGELRFEWVKGHSGDAMNDFVDGLAVIQRDQFRNSGDGGQGSDASGPAAGTGVSGARLADLPWAQQRIERRRRDPRIPAGRLVVVFGHAPPELGGWDPNPTADRVREQIRALVEGLAATDADTVVVTGLRSGAEQLGAEAALRADVPYVAVLGFPHVDRHLSDGARRRFADLRDRAGAVVQLEKKVPADREAFAKAMRRRDAWLVAAADEAILVWDETDDRFDRLFSDLDRREGLGLTVVNPHRSGDRLF